MGREVAPHGVATIPNAVTTGRVLLLAGFVYLVVAHQLRPALLAFTAAWALDAVDGLVARRFGQATTFGYLFDKIVDRALLITAGVILIREGYLPPAAVLLFTKDIAVVPALAMQLLQRERLADLGTAGKALTVAQGAALLWLALLGTYVTPITLVVALAGGVIGYHYVYRVVYRQ